MDFVRSLANKYLKEEFKLHYEADPKYLKGFLGEWLGYYDKLVRSKNIHEFMMKSNHEEQLKGLDDSHMEALAQLKAIIYSGKSV